MTIAAEEAHQGDAGAFGVNYALRPNKFIDRRVFVEVINRYSNFCPIQEHIYVGLGSFALEDHKLMNSAFGIHPLISLELDADVVVRQKFNAPLSYIKPTQYSTEDFVTRKEAIFREFEVASQANAIVWFDMTDAASISAHLNTFGNLLRISAPGDVVRMTVDVDAKTFGRAAEGEAPEDLDKRRFATLRELIGDLVKTGARAQNVSTKYGIAELILHAFKLVVEQVFSDGSALTFEPISLTTYADGHRMLSVTGVVLERGQTLECRKRMDVTSVPGGADGWDSLIDIQVPQLTIWEKLSIDRDLHRKTPKQLANGLKFKLHENVPTEELLESYAIFYRFYPNFRHVLL